MGWYHPAAWRRHGVPLFLSSLNPPVMLRLASLPPVTRAILAMIAAVTLFSAMNASIKWLGGRYPVSQIMFFRAVFAMVVLLPLIWRAGGLMSLRTQRPLGTWRAALSVSFP